MAGIGESLKGLRIKVNNIPYFDGVNDCLKNNVRSSLFDQNYNLIKGRGRRILELKDGAIRGS